MAGAGCSISAVTDVLMHANTDMEGGADRQPWCGGDAAQGQKGALGSRERRKRKRKRKEVRLTLINLAALSDPCRPSTGDGLFLHT